MCGRVSIGDLTANSLQLLFALERPVPLPQSYNLAPPRPLPAIRQHNHARSLDLLPWGLIPHWCQDPSIARSTFNARLETLSQKPSFRDPFKAQRCIIPVSGFYQWRNEGRRKQPYYIFRADRQPVALAGLWDSWQGGGSEKPIESCTMVTSAATHLVAEISERMPAILEPDYFAVWLDPRFSETHVLQDILRAAAPDLEMYAVSGYVNNADNDGAKCIERVAP
ncbi:MAG TPA: SOS response-associated peptidase [Geopsychrobacteraceae bacterium]